MRRSTVISLIMYLAGFCWIIAAGAGPHDYLDVVLSFFGPLSIGIGAGIIIGRRLGIQEIERP